MSQEPTVLVRIYGRTRDAIDALRQNKYGDYGPKESFAAAIDRFVVDAAPKKKPAGKRSRRRRRVSSKRKGKKRRSRR